MHLVITLSQEPRGKPRGIKSVLFDSDEASFGECNPPEIQAATLSGWCEHVNHAGCCEVSPSISPSTGECQHHANAQFRSGPNTQRFPWGTALIPKIFDMRIVFDSQKIAEIFFKNEFTK
jgi:hypothetical protein